MSIRFTFIIGIIITILACKKEKEAPLPIADFFVEVLNCTNDTCTVKFYDNSKNAITWIWNFGNGKTSFKENATTKFQINKKHTIQLKIKNIDGIDAMKIKDVNI